MNIRTSLIRIGVVAALLVALLAPAASATSTSDVLDRAVEAIGGDALTDLESLRTDATGIRWTLDEGQVPGSGATVPGDYSTTTSIDVVGDNHRLDTELTSFFVFQRELSEVITPDGGFIDGQDGNFNPPGVAPMLTDRWMSTGLHQRLLYPHLLLLDALEHPEALSSRRDLLVFEKEGSPLYLQFDRRTKLPTRAWTVESDPLRRDLLVLVRYHGWTEVDGLQVPTEVTVKYGGHVVQQETRHAVEVNPDLDPEQFEFPEGIEPIFDAGLATRGMLRHQFLQSFAALGFPRDGLQPNVVGTELAPGVHFLTGGSHNSLAVVQDDGVVIVEAPLDEVRVDAITDWVDANIGLPITHVVASHHHSDHSAGVRQFVNAGARAVVHQDAKQFFRRVLRAPSRIIPDGPSTVPNPESLISAVPPGGSYTIEDAVNPVGVHTIDSVHADDLVIVEAGGVLFVVDIYNPGLPPSPQAAPILPRVLELGLDIDLIAGGHAGTIAWDDFVDLFTP